MSDTTFATPMEYIVNAFDTYMANITMPARVLAKFREDYTYFNHHKPEDCEKCAIYYLSDVDFTWPDFDSWREYFRKIDAWPVMWFRLRDFKPPTEQHEILSLFSVKMLRNALSGYVKTTSKSRKPELMQLMSEYYTVDQITDMVHERFPDAFEDDSGPDKEDIIKLLSHTLSMSICSLRDKHMHLRQLRRSNNDRSNFVYRLPKAYCPIEIMCREKRMKGEIKGYPPFFPGDRNSLQLLTTEHVEEFQYGPEDVLPVDIDDSELLPLAPR